MPKVMVWIRKEDYAKWQAIENKPEWLSLVIKTYPPSLEFAAHLSAENKKLDHLIKHPEKVKLDGLAGIINDDKSTYDSLSREPTLTPPEDAA